ncbi:MAG: pseudouridine synthase [Vicinamibacterales bacterium]
MPGIRVLETSAQELVVVKPAGLQCEVPRDSGADSLVKQLGLQRFDNLRLVHRLDAPACGLVVVARTAEAAA